MQVSTKGRYGLRIMVELALRHGSGPVLVTTIARNQQLPGKYIHVLVGGLKAAGLVTAVRGPNGGLELAREPARITPLDVMEALEGRLTPEEEPLEAGPYDPPGDGVVREVWAAMAEAMEASLRSHTLAELADRVRTRAGPGAVPRKLRTVPPGQWHATSSEVDTMADQVWKNRILTPLQFVLSVALFGEAALILGLAAFPALKLVLWALALPLQGNLHVLALGLALGAAYFLFGLTLMVLLPIARWVTFAQGTPVGSFSYVSWEGWRWASFNALTLFLRFSFVNWVRLTPFLPVYHRLMGMRIGARVQINTAVVADQNLITIGDDTVIGGDVTLVGHVAERGRLYAAPVVIGRQVTVGLMSVIFPGCVIGDGAILAAGSVLAKGAKVGPGEIWSGVPARRVGRRHGFGPRAARPALQALPLAVPPDETASGQSRA